MSAIDILVLFVVGVAAGALSRLVEYALDRDVQKASLHDHALAVMLYAAPAFLASSAFLLIPAGTPHAPPIQVTDTRIPSTDELRAAIIRNVTVSEPPAIRV